MKSSCKLCLRVVLYAFSIILATSGTKKIYSQTGPPLEYHPNSYILHLPSSWMKPKLIKALTNILPLTIDELKGRKFDSTGRAKYCVHLIIDSVRTNQVQNINRVASSSIQFNYSFHGALLVLDSLERPVSMLKLVDINEVFEFRKEVNTGAEPGIYEYENVYDTSGMVVGRRLIEVVKPYYPVYNNSNDPKEYLAYTHLLDICEDKVYNVQRLLRRMK